ncbi:MAG: nitroreductase [Pseudotabrizicola sp.]|uniref:nitroreductase family protein n=1 Tax=Pseudotabrizicola sp. TaxID=2939647 RepID=UPI002718C4C2|nr:nitroreductase [Pseudotabrizicola sp.]MDO8882875.1 nitroreductase [Pseudotabrizicola sp.]MDP2081442.1 nitroreductase [Pseudotabrizicola sp.]MDZ7572955.1 nitroreductase [Pseudotabrizicola sp.]
MPDPNPAVLDYLALRQSPGAKTFTAPVPDRDQILKILSLALRVPDHGKLEPWRMIVLDRAAMARLADLAEARAQAMGGDAEKIEKGRGQFDRGQLAVVVISSPKAAEKVPLAEQVLSAGALCMNVVHAATAAGWGVCWLSGWPSHDAEFRAQAFGCAEHETVAGIIHIATPTPMAPDRPRPDVAKLVSWG